MVDRTSLEAVFLEHLAVIERIAAMLARRHGLSGEDAADFVSWVKLKLVEDDYAVFRKFRGESAMGTYLTVVIAMLARDDRVRRWGRWRPSSAARRLGAVAMRLETLVRRQGYRVDQAGEVLRTAGDTSLSDRELTRLLARLPDRAPLRPVDAGAQPLANVQSDAGAEVLVEGAIDREERQRVERILDHALGELPLEDRLILRMRFWEGLSVADVARALGVEQKPLYRRIDRLLAQLRRGLAAAGVGGELVADILDDPAA